jgi:hypothetical protein
MSGSGFKVFVDGDVLTAAEVNDFLMKQTVVYYADPTARDLDTPFEGKVVYIASSNQMQFYTGTTWIRVEDVQIYNAKGDLAVGTAADTRARLTVGSNEERLVADSAAATGLKYVADTTNYAIAAKGDLLAGTAADTVAPLTVGTNGQVLTADSSTSTGLAWATLAAGGGKILQVVSAFVPAGFSSSSTTNVDITDVTVSITPASLSNKVMIVVQMYLETTAGIALIDLVRNSTLIAQGTGGSTFNSTAGANASHISFVDSPNTTSATTYKLQGRNSTAGTFYVGRNGAGSWSNAVSIIALEIEG